jgi:hypothetical protein
MQPSKARTPISEREYGGRNSIDARLVQSLKARVPIFVTELGISIDVRLVHSKKTLSPISVTELGRTIDIRLVQP